MRVVCAHPHTAGAASNLREFANAGHTTPTKRTFAPRNSRESQNVHAAKPSFSSGQSLRQNSACSLRQIVVGDDLLNATVFFCWVACLLVRFWGTENEYDAPFASNVLCNSCVCEYEASARTRASFVCRRTCCARVPDKHILMLCACECVHVPCPLQRCGTQRARVTFTRNTRLSAWPTGGFKCLKSGAAIHRLPKSSKTYTVANSRKQNATAA